MKTLPEVERAGAKLAAALRVVLEETAEQVDTSTGEVPAPRVAGLAAMWAIEAVVPRGELAVAVAVMVELAPPLDSDADEACDGRWSVARNCPGEHVRSQRRAGSGANQLPV
ncbi:hypothetical protein D7Y56_00640 (plasmid) [Streptomyces sp. S501]|nr:hypothetical protein [Streptomyces sp. S501]QBR04581.1 hypothetical protein D7Y56_00640 [Streptomyces sp. S501]